MSEAPGYHYNNSQNEETNNENKLNSNLCSSNNPVIMICIKDYVRQYKNEFIQRSDVLCCNNVLIII